MSLTTERPLSAADERAKPHVAAPTLHHINLKTTRKDEMIAWYQAVVGAQVLFHHPAFTFLSNDSANHRIALLQVPGIAEDPDRIHHDGMRHSAWEYTSFEELNDTYLRLRHEGILPAACIDHGASLSYYYADPDGNLVELQVDAFGDWEQSRRWMVEELINQEFLVGAAVDPDKIAQAHASGLSFAEIHANANAGEYSTGQLPDLHLPAPPPDAPPIIRV
jgi:catechol-2,3-dioxygenase